MPWAWQSASSHLPHETSFGNRRQGSSTHAITRASPRSRGRDDRGLLAPPMSDILRKRSGASHPDGCRVGRHRRFARRVEETLVNVIAGPLQRGKRRYRFTYPNAQKSYQSRLILIISIALPQAVRSKRERNETSSGSKSKASFRWRIDAAGRLLRSSGHDGGLVHHNYI